MILTCPECATGYFVDDAQIGPAGRKVRCTACGARWTATPEGPLELSTTEEGAIGKPAPTPEPDPGPLAGDDLPRAFRRRAEEERKLRRAAANRAIWAGVGVVAALAIGSAALFREGVARVWPQTASAYAAVGLPVNPVGLVIEDVTSAPALEQGHAVLEVSGVIRNVVDRAAAAPPLRISLADARGRRAAGQIDALANARIPPGQTRRFVTDIVDPPYSAGHLQVDFAVGARPDGAGATPPLTLTLRSPAGDLSDARASASPAVSLSPANAASAANAAAAP